MLLRLLIAWIAIVSCCSAVAQEPATTDQSDQKKKIYVAFRVQNWKAKHMHDAAKVEKYISTLKTLGCEVKTNAHNGHTDVSYRTVFWKTLALNSHDQAHEWIKWFHSVGFDTIHGHLVGKHQTKAAAGQHLEVVQYRLADWNAESLQDSAELNQLLALYRGMGIEVKVDTEAGRHDVSKRCPEWMEIELPSHDAANKWQDFLTDAGFETKHVHRK